ncbi:S8 family serine peptidase [Amycolatopsis sp. NPDC051071]|uniref:S8 family serine peptidase n=1 Tax=Amycolatopsis sp. NPDC051071 TaxID=3154637 RepID=UPI00341F626D
MTALRDIPGVSELWRESPGHPDVVVGVLDGRPDLGHPALRGADIEVLEPRWLGSARDAGPPVEHGTFITAVLFGRHDSATPGFVPRCRGVVVPAVRVESDGLDPLNLARSIEALVAAGVHLIHCSVALPTLSGDADPLFKRAVAAAVEAGVLIVTPTGNEGGRSLAAPGILPGVLAVGAYADDGTMFRYSNWGSAYLPHAVVAPGEFEHAVPGGTRRRKGTSVAAPVVTGMAALLASARVGRGLPADPLGVRDALVTTANPCGLTDSVGEPGRCLAGRVDLRAAARVAVADDVLPSLLPLPVTPVFALGRLGFGFTSRQIRDRFTHPEDPCWMAEYLAAHPDTAVDLVWTVEVDGSPQHAVTPAGPYRSEIFAKLIAVLAAQERPGPTVDLVSVAGTAGGTHVRLIDGGVVPVASLSAPVRLSAWSVTDRVRMTISAIAPPPHLVRRIEAALRDFVDAVTGALRNPGRHAPQRALNHAAVDLIPPARALAAASARDLVLRDLAVARSPYGRPDSDSWDICLEFTNPDDEYSATTEWRFTVDVADVDPVSFGEPRTWTRRT